jgi:beta-glucosidase
MKLSVFGATAASLVALTVAMASAASAAPARAAAPRIGSPALSEAEIRSRADALLAQMTPEEKAGQLQILFAVDRPAMIKAVEGQVQSGGVGALLFVTDPKQTNHLQRLAIDNSRLKIPLLFGFDVIHGLTTIFPVPIANAASWDPAGVERAQAVAASEARAVGIHWTFAPMVDIARDPRWGRIVEGAGEDPFLGSAMAAAQVRGFQGPAIGGAGSLPAPSISPLTAPRSAAATMTRSTSPTPSCGTSISRPSRRRSTPGRATS